MLFHCATVGSSRNEVGGADALPPLAAEAERKFRLQLLLVLFPSSSPPAAGLESCPEGDGVAPTVVAQWQWGHSVARSAATVPSLSAGKLPEWAGAVFAFASGSAVAATKERVDVG